ncbi:MlaD family protein [Sciscionella marina]|uniref:MlaD family protein n=1 Tax=Sciscionella marina TaxID=508770 RepID=UPI0003749770|nr:MlaD family protein [Sciscionella marina]
MKIKHSTMVHIRLGMVLAFAAACLAFFGYLWVGSGGRIPLVTSEGYRISVDIPHVSNLVENSEVMAAGVGIGKVVSIEPDGGQARVTMQLDAGPRPLHEGATVRVRYKTLLEESFVEVHDGAGAPLRNGTLLPDGSGQPAVELNDVLNSLDRPTRQALASSVRSLGKATSNSQDSLSAAMAGVGDMSREGRGALDALAGQSGDLRKLTGDAATLVAALDNKQGQIAKLVSDADQISKVTANGQDDIRTTLRKLPGVLDSARRATSGLGSLSDSLAPVATNLKRSAPQVSAALRQLPATASDLRGLLPSLDRTLDRAPGTLDRVPAVSKDVSAAIPHVDVALRDVNPMLSYLRPYAHDLTAFFTNFGQSLNTDSGVLKVGLIANEKSAPGLPLTTQLPLFNRNNPYPGPGSAVDPAPFTGKYPHIKQEGK